jgi:hypothetical protein
MVIHSKAVHRPELRLSATFEACTLIADIMQDLDRRHSMALEDAEHHLQKLQNFSDILSDDIKQFSHTPDKPVTTFDQQRVIGNIHVACTYYFAIMLVTRSFLISHLMTKLRDSSVTMFKTSPTNSSPTAIADMAQACTDSAMLMTQTCRKAFRSGLLINGMPLLK